MDLRNVFISNIKEYRKQRKLSQMALAEKCGTSTSYIGEIEIGKKFPSIEMIQKIADSLEIQPFKLFMTQDDKYQKRLSKELAKNLATKLIEDINKFTDFN